MNKYLVGVGHKVIIEGLVEAREMLEYNQD